jgi:hypothetical protein
MHFYVRHLAYVGFMLCLSILLSSTFVPVSSSSSSSYEVYTCDGVLVTDDMFPVSDPLGVITPIASCYQWLDVVSNTTVTYRLQRASTKAQVQLFWSCVSPMDAALAVQAYVDTSGQPCQAMAHPWDDVVLEIDVTTDRCPGLTAWVDQRIYSCWESHYDYARTVIASILGGLFGLLFLPGIVYYIWNRCKGRRLHHRFYDDTDADADASHNNSSSRQEGAHDLEMNTSEHDEEQEEGKHVRTMHSIM